AGLSFTLDPQPGACLDSSRDLNFHLLFALNATSAPTVSAGILHHATCAATGLASPGYRKESLLIANLSAAATVAACLRLGARSSAISFTSFASFQTRNTQLGSHAVIGIFERDLEVVTKVSATLRC